MLVVLDVALTKYHRAAVAPVPPAPQRFALVTGASSGIGREIAFELAKRGYSLVIASRTRTTLEKVQTEIEGLYAPVKVLVCACDLSTHDGIAALVNFVATNDLVVDILVNNAGASLSKDFVDLSPRQMEEILTLDVVSVAKLTHALVPAMVTRGVGRVLNIASMASAVCIPGSPLYGSSKAFMLNFSQAIDYELRSTGVSVTCFCPGPVHTNFGVAADCEQALFFKVLPVLDAHACATQALTSMFDADGYAYDSLLTYVCALSMRSVMPPRLALLFGAMNWSPASKMLACIRR